MLGVTLTIPSDADSMEHGPSREVDNRSAKQETPPPLLWQTKV
jgi:hypothetical protein